MFEEAADERALAHSRFAVEGDCDRLSLFRFPERFQESLQQFDEVLRPMLERLVS